MINQTKKIDRLKTKLAEAEYEKLALIRSGKIIIPQKLRLKIEFLKKEIEEAEQYEPKKLSEILDRKTLDESGIAHKIVKMHLAADYLYDCAFDLKDTLRRLGLEDCNLFKYVNEIRVSSEQLAGIVCNPRFAGLADLITNDERMIDDINLLVTRYINQRFKIT